MKITEYIKDTRTEMTHVTWPSRKQAILFSVAVVVVSIATALFLGLFDYIFSRLLTLFV
jgi:preprotein translocase SecE subunit